MKVSLSHQLSAHRKKREALEQLISFARQVCVAGDSMQALQYAVRPSQKMQGSTLFFNQMKEHLLPVDTAVLQKRLVLLDESLVAEVDSFMKIASLSEADFIHLYYSEDSEGLEEGLDALTSRVDAFRRKTQTDVAIRMVLQERGVQLQALRLGITQESLAGQIDDVQKKEVQCKKKIVAEIKTLLVDTQHIIGREAYPEPIRSHMNEVEAQLCMALTHIEKGGRLEDLPFNIEVHEEYYQLPVGFSEKEAMGDGVEIGAEYEADKEVGEKVAKVIKTEPLESDASKEQGLAVDEKCLPHQQKSFFHILHEWLNSSSGVSWKDIKNNHDRR